MGKVDTHKLAIDGKEPNNLRGDPITNDRYFSKEFMPYKIGYISKNANAKTFMFVFDQFVTFRCFSKFIMFYAIFCAVCN